MPNTKFDSKSFNPQAFGHYVNRIPNPNKTELAKSGAVGTNEQARNALATQTGSLYSRIPYFGRISGETSQNNTGADDINSTSTTTYEQGFVVASRMDAWTEKSFSKNITAGVDFMDNVAAQISEYKMEVKQAMLLAILDGVFSMSTSGSTVAAKAAKEFLDKHVYDIADTSGDGGYVGVATLNKAIQKACGDNKNIFKLAIMHSTVATNLENLRLLKYLTYTDSDGVQRDLTIGTWNGRTVLIDDNMPVKSGYYAAASTDEGAMQVKASDAATGEINLADVKKGDFYPANVGADDYVVAGSKYTTYVLGNGSIVLDDIGDSVPYEMNRDPKTNGGQDTLYVRDRFICGVEGISFEKPASITASASNDDLKTGANWNIINDTKQSISHKTIALCKIISRG